jgi:para-aminobenzoate synthetase component I
MTNKTKVIENMNNWGKKSIPFLFIIDFEMKNPLVYRIDEINNDEIRYQLNENTNYGYNGSLPSAIDFNKLPISLTAYSRQFDKVIHHIAMGNTYLLNLTCATPIKTNLSLSDIYNISESKYKLLFRNEFVCFSPETFISISNGKVRSYPMKGTIDASIENAEQLIMTDEKETAEHYTIVDLIRNDLNIVAKNVAVEKFRYIDTIKTSHKDLLQVSSIISGDLGSDYASHIGDLIFTLLPAGSISGAPKKKTVEIILNTEEYQRGYYTGIFGYFDGKDLDSAVMIRFIENTSKGMIYKSGGGITSFSDMESEYHEMIDKVYVPINRKH